MILCIENLTIKFNHTTVVNNISFSTDRGKVLGIVGESGSGKSMTALSIMRLLPANAKQSGSITFFEEEKKIELTTWSEQQYQRLRGNTLSMIFQDPLSAFNSTRKIGTQLLEALAIHQPTMSGREREHRIIETLRKVQLDSTQRILNSYPFQLSGGQRQRALIAMALLNSPKVLIADEPTTALDVTVQKEIVELLKMLVKNENLSLLFISHDLGLVSYLADDLLVMKNGNIMDYGTTNQVLKNPVSEYTRALLKCKPTLNQAKVRLPEVDDIIQQKNIASNKTIFPQKIISTQNPILTVKNLSVEYRSKHNSPTFRALNNINLTLNEGETLGLIGESGCGKTTLSRTLLNLINPVEGTLLLNHFPLSEIGKNRKQLSKLIQIVFQDPFSSLNPANTIGFTLKETIAEHYPKLTKTEVDKWVTKWLLKVGLDETYRKRKPLELSGGQCQRIVIARALIPKPKILICDEAVSALDVSVQAKILNLLNDLKQEFSLTYLFISHDLSVVKYMSDRIIIMKNGCLIEEGDSETIFSRPQNEYSKTLIFSHFNIPESI
ncbi:MAG TPA: ABC transporter ATP-binding protein [Salinivirgaceae bacterium]|nr:ABC transporter ATP-binding protein [Salinivirgaceae bacterium]